MGVSSRLFLLLSTCRSKEDGWLPYVTVPVISVSGGGSKLYPKMNALWWKTLLKWMIWGKPTIFGNTQTCSNKALTFMGIYGYPPTAAPLTFGNSGLNEGVLAILVLYDPSMPQKSIKTGWWFQTFIFTLTLGNDPIWQLFFRWVEIHQLEKLVFTKNYLFKSEF